MTAFLLGGQPLNQRTEGYERRKSERRHTGACAGRRVDERRSFATMQDRLNAEADRHDGARKYTGEPLSNFGNLA